MGVVRCVVEAIVSLQGPDPPAGDPYLGRCSRRESDILAGSHPRVDLVHQRAWFFGVCNRGCERVRQLQFG